METILHETRFRAFLHDIHATKVLSQFILVCSWQFGKQKENFFYSAKLRGALDTAAYKFRIANASP